MQLHAIPSAPAISSVTGASPQPAAAAESHRAPRPAPRVLVTAPAAREGATVTLARPDPALRLQDVGVGEISLDLALYPGEIVHLAGGAQAARLRVLAMAAGFDPCGSGRCTVLGHELHELDEHGRRALRDRDIARVLGCDHLPEAATVLALVAMPLVRQGLALAEARARAELELDALGCSPLLDRRPETLDEGESRLVLLARAMVARPRLLVLEHPEHALSAVAVSAVRLALWSLSSAFGTCVLMSTDHPRLIASADRYIDLDRAPAERM